MRVLQVATLVSPDGAYGGPVRVGVNQCEALRDLGHQPVLAAGTRGYPSPPRELSGTPVQLFPTRRLLPKTGFAGLASPGLLRWFRGNVGEFDVVHVHLARDLVTLPVAVAALLAKVPLIVQTHGMIDESQNPLARPLDGLFTRRVLRGADAVLYLTTRERGDLGAVAGHLDNLENVINGVPTPSNTPDATRSGVLYLARLQKRKRPLDFVHAALALQAKHPDISFSLVGPDEGEGPAVRALAAESQDKRIRWEGALPPEQVTQRLSQAQLYVLPSVDEPFPMSVLEAMSVGTPVVVTDTCGLAETIQKTGSGLVTDGTPGSLTAAMDTLLSDPETLSKMGENARRTALDQFSMRAVGSKLESLYSNAQRQR